MAVENGKITKPVGISDIRTAMGVSANGIGQLCMHDALNAYSKYKPMRHNTLTGMTDAMRIGVNWGYHVPSQMRMDDLCKYMVAEDNNGGSPTYNDWKPSSDEAPYKYLQYGWWYQRPQGGEKSPYRMGDFDKYDHNAAAYVFMTSDIPSTIDGAFTVDLKGTIDINNPDDVGTNTNPGNMGSLAGKTFVVAALATHGSYANDYTRMKFKTAPCYLSGTLLHTIVYFSDEDVTNLFYAGAGTYRLYFMLAEREDITATSGGNTYYLSKSNLYMQAPYKCYHTIASNDYISDQRTYAALGAKEKAIPLPIKPVDVTYAEAPVVSPIANLTFSFASGGSITYTAAKFRFNISFPTLTATNSSTTSPVTVNRGMLYMEVYAQKRSDPSKRWTSAKYGMGLSGTATVPVNGSQTVFSAMAMAVQDTSISTFLENDDISEYLLSALVYYRDTNNNIYWHVATLAV